jgi:hypothetical protein
MDRPNVVVIVADTFRALLTQDGARQLEMARA